MGRCLSGALPEWDAARGGAAWSELELELDHAPPQACWMAREPPAAWLHLDRDLDLDRISRSRHSDRCTPVAADVALPHTASGTVGSRQVGQLMHKKSGREGPSKSGHRVGGWHQTCTGDAAFVVLPTRLSGGREPSSPSRFPHSILLTHPTLHTVWQRTQEHGARPMARPGDGSASRGGLGR